MGIYPGAQGSAKGPATATGTITEIKKSRSTFTGGFGLADHGLLILGGLTEPSTYAISFDVR
ncbi:hypothetical protein [Amycolatopsis eburnea]|uniref:Uncharacterized protein n=1 Tax=Amycolatopsis eburnea TaxID=2267691 RepID=A0A3R9F6M2_9PSEU|nr:hypothetical protein [Amycolatopsis eburnea]RSD13685.1 hypothetical protein EIY87_28750 [Amycolatopsis eburnea]